MGLDRYIAILTSPTVIHGPVILEEASLLCEGEAAIELGPNVSVASRLPETGVGIFLLICAMGVGAVCGGLGSFDGTAGVVCAGVMPALLLGMLGLLAMMRSPRLLIEVDGERTTWSLPKGSDKAEVKALVERINRDCVPATGPIQACTLVFQGNLPKTLSPAIRTMEELDVSEPLPTVNDAAVMERLAKADRAWDITFLEDELETVMEWGTTCNAIFMLGEVTDSLDDPELDAFVDGLENSPPADAVERRREMRFALRDIGLRTPPAHLPFIDAGEFVLRSPEEVGQRVHATFLVSMAAQEFLAAGQIEQLAAALADADLSPNERAFVASPDAESAQELAWRLEAMVMLSWALGRREEPPEVDATWELDGEEDTAMIVAAKDGEAGVELRTVDEIADRLEAIYCLRWLAVDAALRGEGLEGLEAGVLFQQHSALCWLTEDVAWDDVSPST